MNEKDRNSLLTLKAKIILALNLVAILILWSFTLVNAQEGFPENPACKSDWFLIWELPNSKHCQDFGEENLGDYFLYGCWGEKESQYFGTYKTIVAYYSFCGYTSSITSDKFFEFLPLVVK
ncbi:MAG: hypothetical protein BV456_01800 [Thermoplasmata archaeon M8B2D]|nr:MAG: hypothetical protein BV456_01800 [Thermoplasmata archaeon M8B2D]